MSEQHGAHGAVETLHERDLENTMRVLGKQATIASRILRNAPTKTKNKALTCAAMALREQVETILIENQKDLDAGRAKALSAALLDRLELNSERINAIAGSLCEIANLADPVGAVTAAWDRPNGLEIERVRTPLGVIGVIFESRPNVTADAGALCLKSGNAVILRGGTDSFHSSRAIHACIAQGLQQAGLPAHAVQLVETTERAAVGEMLSGLDGAIDIIIPRGGKSLVERVQREARVPVFAHLEGLCHVYIDGAAQLDMAVDVTFNAKLRRTGICGSAETLLIDSAVAGTHLKPIVEKLIAGGCEIRGDGQVCAVISEAIPATPQDWRTEYLDKIISVRIVDGIGGAIDHIQEFTSNHTECVITDDPHVATKFFNEIDSAILLHNASTQFADGGEFGMGAEIGIATGKVHARGPVGLEQLTSFKYRVRGSGQTRPV